MDTVIEDVMVDEVVAKSTKTWGGVKRDLVVDEVPPASKVSSVEFKNVESAAFPDLSKVSTALIVKEITKRLDQFDAYISDVKAFLIEYDRVEK